MPESVAPTYLIVTGASVARRAPEVLRALAPVTGRLLTLLTPGARRVISPRELALVPGHRIVESYFDAAILPRPAPGVVVIAPCTFNTLKQTRRRYHRQSGALYRSPGHRPACPADRRYRGQHPLVDTSPRPRFGSDAAENGAATVLDPITDGGTVAMAPPETIAAAVRRARSRLACESV